MFTQNLTGNRANILIIQMIISYYIISFRKATHTILWVIKLIYSSIVLITLRLDRDLRSIFTGSLHVIGDNLIRLPSYSHDGENKPQNQQTEQHDTDYCSNHPIRNGNTTDETRHSRVSTIHEVAILTCSAIGSSTTMTTTFFTFDTIVIYESVTRFTDITDSG